MSANRPAVNVDTPTPPQQPPPASTGRPTNVQESALMGLRRRLAQEREAIEASNTIVARIRRRNDAELDESIRRNAETRANSDRQQRVSKSLQPPPLPMGSNGESAPRTPSDGQAPRLGGMLTQVQQPGHDTPNDGPRNGDSGRGLRGMRQAYVDEARLKELRRKPKNVSPCAALHLTPLLPPQIPEKQGKITLVLDIDETLVHASFNTAKPFNTRLTIETETERGYIYVAFRPKLKEFLDFVAPLFEVVVFTASMSCYAEQLMDQLDPQNKLGKLRLFREHCTELRQARIKDLGLLGRPLDRVAIIDNSQVAYLFQPRNAIPIVSWFDDKNDREFERLMPMLAELAECQAVYDVLDVWNSMVFA